jgi:hypothetical protein
MSLSDPFDAAAGIELLASFPAAVDGVRAHEPFTAGVPFPRGQCTDAQTWAIAGTGGGRRQAQTRVLDRWRDGSVRWLLVDGIADLSAASRSVRLTAAESGTAAGPDAPIAITRSAAGVRVDTGAATFSLEPGSALPFADVIAGGLNVLEKAKTELVVVDDSGERCPAIVDSVSIDESGPSRAVVRMKGSIQRRGEELLQLDARVHFFAGLPTVRLLVTLRNPKAATHPGGFWDLGDPGSVFVKEASLVLALAKPDEEAPAIRYSPETGAPWETCTNALEIYQDSSGGKNWQSTNHVNKAGVVPNAFCGYRLAADGQPRTGTRATPIVSIDTGPRRVAAVMPKFWQNFPSSIEAAGAVLTIGLFPRQYSDAYEIQGGEQKTHECYLSFGDDGVTSEPLEWCRARPLWYPDPVWTNATGVIPFLAGIDPDHGQLIRSAIEGPDTFEHKREVVDEYGWRHFGDVYGDHEGIRRTGPMPLVSHYNNQYDTVAGFQYQFFRTGDPRWGTLASDLAAHVVDIDVYHTVRDRAAYNHGMFWHTYHYGDAGTSTHRTYPLADRGKTGGGGPSADHNYTTGLMLHYFLTGDEACRDTVLDSAQYVLDIDDGRQTVLRWLSGADTGAATASADGGLYQGPGRGPANSLNALVDGYRLSGDVRFQQKAERLIRRVVHPTENIDDHHLDEPERRWFYTMFLQSLGKYLHDKEERGELDAMHAYARESLLHYAAWMAAHEYPYLEKPERLEFPTETWAAQEIRKSDAFYFAALYAEGEQRARFVERGQFFFRAAVDGLGRAPTRTLARPVIILLSSGLLHSWFQQHPNGAAEARGPAYAPVVRPGRFVMQKQQAKQRLVWLAATGAAAVVALAALFLVYR